MQRSFVGAHIVGKTNTRSFVASIKIISVYEALCDVKYKHKIGAIELVGDEAPTHADLFL